MRVVLWQYMPMFFYTYVIFFSFRIYLSMDEYKTALNVNGSTHLNVYLASWSLKGLATFPWEKHVYNVLGKYSSLFFSPSKLLSSGKFSTHLLLEFLPLSILIWFSLSQILTLINFNFFIIFLLYSNNYQLYRHSPVCTMNRTQFSLQEYTHTHKSNVQYLNLVLCKEVRSNLSAVSFTSVTLSAVIPRNGFL